MDGDFFSIWGNFILTIVLFIGLLIVYTKIAGSNSGEWAKKVLRVIAYPFFWLRSLLSDRFRTVFDYSAMTIYCVGVITLILYFE